jgi:hypothetical protein
MAHATVLRKYGAATTILFDLFDLDGVDMNVAASFATGDVKIMKDEGAEVNTTNLPADEGSTYSLALTATEMQAARVKIILIDQTATKVWLDTSINIETYGNASAQHAMDLDDAVRGGMTALPNAAADAAGGLPISDAGGLDLDTLNSNISAILTDTGTTLETHLTDIKGATFAGATDSLEAIRDRGDAAWTTGSGTGLTSLASGTAQGGSASTIQLAAGESFADDILNGCIVLIHTGTGAGQARVITDYAGATDIATITPNWTTNPSSDSQYEVWPGSVNLAAVSLTPQTAGDLAALINTVDGVVDAILVDTAEIGQAGAGLTEAGGTGDQYTAIPWSAAWDAEVQSEVNDALVAYDAATGADVSGLNDPTAAAIADAVWDELQADHVGVGTMGLIASEIADILVDTAVIGAAGAGLTAIPWNAAWDAEVQSEVADGLTAFFTSSAQLVDDIWDEVLTVGTHNVGNSAGRRLRNIQDFGIYDLARVWVDEAAGTSTGTTDGEDATVTNRANDLDNALTVAASVGLDEVSIQAGNSITLTAALAGYKIYAHEATIALGGQSLAGTRIYGATISGTFTGNPVFVDCILNGSIAALTGPGATLINCRMLGAIIENNGTDGWLIHDARGETAGLAASLTFDFNSTANADCSLRNYSGGLQIEGMVATNEMTIEGRGSITEGTCTAGSPTVRGLFKMNSITNLTPDEEANYNATNVNAEADTALSDYDPPTNAEMEARTLAAASYATAANQSNIETDTQDIQSRLPAALVSGKMDSDMTAISGDTGAADKLEEAATAVVLGTCQTGTLSTTQATTDLAETTNDHYIGRTIVWTTGALAGQASDITDYVGTNGLLTFTAVTEAPSNGDAFVLV